MLTRRNLDGNTSLPHPDADQSPDACISAEDIPVTRVYSRHRLSFFDKHKRTISHGKLTPETELVYNDIGMFAENESVASTEMTNTSSHFDRVSKECVDITAPSSDSTDSDTSVKPRDVVKATPPAPLQHSHEKKRNLLARLFHS
jgi:hypothetical protein